MSDPNHIYLDLDVINNNYNQSGPPPYLRFEEIKNTPFFGRRQRGILLQHSAIHNSKRATPYQCSFRASSLGKTTQTRPYMQFL